VKLKTIYDIVNLTNNPLEDVSFQRRCKRQLDEHGVLVLNDFLQPEVIDVIKDEGRLNQHLAYYTSTSHNIYLAPTDTEFSAQHPRNREVSSSKGCITTDQIPKQSMLHSLYDAAQFKAFVSTVLDQPELYAYADSLSGINLHYAGAGQELGWHFDNSSFAITLLIEQAEAGGEFEYVTDVRDADAGEMNYQACTDILDGKTITKQLAMEPGALVLFRGRNSMHRVTPTVGSATRMLVVLAYNTQPDISLSESARMTFFGRLN
jgi:hypothetical protein